MRKTLANRNQEALVDIEITWHPRALREAFLGRGGYLWRLLRTLLGVAFFLLMVGAELTWPRFFPDVPLHPLWLTIACVGCRSSLFVALLAAWSGGFFLDAGSGALPGAHIIPLMLAVCALRVLRVLPFWKARGGWGRAMFAGALGTFLPALYEGLFLSWGMEWGVWLGKMTRELILGTLLAAFAGGPVFCFCWDCMASLGTGKTLFLPRPRKPLLPGTLPQFPN